MHPKSRAVILASASMLALSTASFAQDESSKVIVLDAITISAGGDNSGPAEGYVASYNQTGTKTDTPMLETQQSTSVVTQQQIKDQGAQNLGQTLNYSAGIVGQPYGADPRFDSPVIRGFEARQAQYLNGLRMIRGFGAPAIETYGLEQVEVMRGPSSALFGEGSLVGIINQVQKRAQFDDFNEAGLSYGTNDNAQVFFDLNRAPSDNLAWRLTGIGKDGSTQIEELTDTRGYLAGALRWQIDDATLVDVLISHQKDSPISPPGVPYWTSQIADGDYLRDFYAGYPSYDDSDRKMTNIGTELRHEFDNGWQLTQGFRYQKVDWDYKGFYVSQTNTDPLIGLGGSHQIEDASTVNLDTRLSGEVTTGAVNHRLLFGLDMRKWDSIADTTFSNVPGIDWRNPNYGISVTPDDWYHVIKDVQQTQAGIYVQDEMSIDKWRASFALRHDRVKLEGNSYQEDFVNGGYTTTPVDQTDSKTTGRAGVSYIFDSGFAPYVSYATSFQPQENLGPKGNTLAPAEGEQWEVGLKYEPIAFDGFFSIAAYDLEETNVDKYLVNGPDGQGNYPIGKVKSKGVEIEGTAELAQGWAIRGAYAYNETEQVEYDTFGTALADNGKELPNAPNHSASLWLTRGFDNGLRVGGGLRYVGSRYGDFANTYTLAPITTVDLGATYSADKYEASLNITNLLDETYLANCGSFGCYYGEGRGITAKVSYKW